MVEPIRRRPPEAVLVWAARSLAPGSRVVGCRRLVGGIVSSVHRVSVVDARGGTHQLVLKRWVEEPREQAISSVEREAGVLAALEHSGLPVPRLVGRSLGDETDGHPALLMTRLPGRVFLTPEDPKRWIGQMAQALARIHSLSIDAEVCVPWGAQQIPPRVPAWSRRPHLWQEAARILAGPSPDGAAFIHGDYQHFNVLWARRTLTGVIDWTLAGIGHPDRDVGHCQLNLAVLFSAEWAKAFAAAYQAEAGRAGDGWWSLYEICLYSEEWPRTIPLQVGNRAPIDIAGMNGRIDDLLESALR